MWGAAVPTGMLDFFSRRFLTVFLQQRRGHDILPGPGQHPQRPVRHLRLRHRHGGGQRGDPHQGEIPQDVPRQRRYLPPRECLWGAYFHRSQMGFSPGALWPGRALLGEPRAPRAQRLLQAMSRESGHGAAPGMCRLQVAPGVPLPPDTAAQGCSGRECSFGSPTAAVSAS